MNEKRPAAVRWTAVKVPGPVYERIRALSRKLTAERDRQVTLGETLEILVNEYEKQHEQG